MRGPSGNGSGASHSIWSGDVHTPSTSPLGRDVSTDVCVVGAGLAGLTTAYLLTREGRQVTVIDDGPIGGGETSRTTAHLTNVIDDRYSDIEKLHGEIGARITAASHTEAIDVIEQIVAEEDIQCDFERLDAYLFTPPGDSASVLERELVAARRAGLGDVEMVQRVPLASFDTGPALRFPRQGQFHPLQYIAALARAVVRERGSIYTGTHATKIAEGPPPRVETEHGAVITARSIVVATNTPVHHLVKFHTKQAAYRTFVVAGRVPRGSVTRALYYDTPWPYHYARLHRMAASQEELLIVGGEDHKTGQHDDSERRWSRLETWARERFPMLGTIEHRWSGQVIEPVDAVAYIGRDPDARNIYVVTGDSGMGMTHSTIAGLLITDLIQGRDNPWRHLYDPSRVTFRAVGEFARENLNVAVQYLDHLKIWEDGDGHYIPRGGAAVVRRGLHMVAIYRDGAGVLHERSATCPHLGCVVAWNRAEKTWDCPCHGSRFDPHGRVLNGPAIADLNPVEAPEKSHRQP
jgi:glycine/D-amino acid oxidase-like deaminating enzyme/nitrite reductase/ring-hydroxylating ferredoxin subunit